MLGISIKDSSIQLLIPEPNSQPCHWNPQSFIPSHLIPNHIPTQQGDEQAGGAYDWPFANHQRRLNSLHANLLIHQKNKLTDSMIFILFVVQLSQGNESSNQHEPATQVDKDT
jgi:hypothetical protein